MHQHDRKPPIDGSAIPPQSLCKSLTRQARLIYSSQGCGWRGGSLSVYYWSVVVCLHSSPQTRLTAARLARMSNLGSYALINDQSVALHYAIRDYGWHRTDFDGCHLRWRGNVTRAVRGKRRLALVPPSSLYILKLKIKILSSFIHPQVGPNQTHVAQKDVVRASQRRPELVISCKTKSVWSVTEDLK